MRSGSDRLARRHRTTRPGLGVLEQHLGQTSQLGLQHRGRAPEYPSGGLRETQDMLDFCAAHGIGAEVELIAADGITDSYRRLEASDVRFRFVIDNSTLAKA